MQAAALAQLAIVMLPLIETGVSQFIAWITELRTAVQQSGEWTAAQEAAFRAALLAKTGDAAYGPENRDEDV